jgi:hypothetical protein
LLNAGFGYWRNGATRCQCRHDCRNCAAVAGPIQTVPDAQYGWRYGHRRYASPAFCSRRPVRGCLHAGMTVSAPAATVDIVAPCHVASVYSASSGHDVYRCYGQRRSCRCVPPSQRWRIIIAAFADGGVPLPQTVRISHPLIVPFVVAKGDRPYERN